MTRDPDFSTVLRTRGATSEFLTWLLDDNGHSATSTRAFLDVCFLHLTPQKRSAVTKEISNSEAEAIEHMIYELVAHELLFRLKVNRNSSRPKGLTGPTSRSV